jgi:hypothetical protein
LCYCVSKYGTTSFKLVRTLFHLATGGRERERDTKEKNYKESGKHMEGTGAKERKEDVKGQ